MRWTMTKRQKISLGCLFLLLSALLAVSGFMVYRDLSGRQKEKREFALLAELVQAKLPEASLPDEPGMPEEEAEPVHRRNLALLFAQNGECIGWLNIPGTGIDYPVMHTPGDPQKYLRKNFYGESSYSGVPFLDSRCSLDSGNLILYGHNMKNGTMFGLLKQYADQGYCREHPIIEFETQSGCAEYAVFAVVPVNAQDEWYRFIEASGQPDFEKKIEYIRSRALYHTDRIPEYGQQLLTLSTCYGSGGDGRLLVIAASRTAGNPMVLLHDSAMRKTIRETARIPFFANRLF